jgi:feruloyl-CoA synthase
MAATGAKVPMATGFGATGTAPSVLGTILETSGPGNIGLPLPSVVIKLLPSGDKLEARVKSPSLMPGYWRDPQNTAKGFDEEGYYRFGDTFKFADVQDPSKGFLFDGQITEDFKLSSGTWVSVGPMRARLIEGFAPLVKDAAIAGHDCNEIGDVVIPDSQSRRALLPESERAKPDAEILGNPVVRDALRTCLTKMALSNTGSSTRVVRVIVLKQPPSNDANRSRARALSTSGPCSPNARTLSMTSTPNNLHPAFSQANRAVTAQF